MKLKFEWMKSIVPAAMFCALISVPPSAMAFVNNGDHFRAWPIGWIDGDMSDVLINEGEALDSSKSEIGISRDLPSEGYRYIHMESLNIKLGVYGGWYPYSQNYASTWWGVGVALMPVAGSALKSNRFVASRAEAQRLAKLQIPAKAEALSQWQAHDSVNYFSRGGIIFSVGAGYFFTGLSGDYFATGDWTTYVEKIEDNKVYVKTTNVKLVSLDRFLGNFIAYDMVSKFQKTDKIFSYIFDLTDPRAQVAFEAMVHGSMIEAQNLQKEDPSLAELILTEEGGTRGRQRKGYFGFPFLNASRETGELLTSSDRVLHDEGVESDEEYALFWSSRMKNILGHHKNAYKNFFTTSYVKRALALEKGAPPAKIETPVDSAGTVGTLVLSYEDDRANRGTIAKMVGDMAKQTGLYEPLQVQDDSGVDISGYVHVSLKVNFTEDGTRQLLETLSGQKPKMMAVGPFVTHQMWLAQGPVLDSLCAAQDNQQVDANQCIQMFKFQTEDAVAKIRSELSQMREADQRGDRKEFVKAYARFGRAILTNQFAFQYVLKLLPESSATIVFEAEGEKIAKLKRTIVMSRR
jgi:hypothetical protein